MLPNGQRWCHCNSQAQSITANSTWCATHNEIFEPRLNGASFSRFVEWESGVWSLPSFFSKQAGNWTWKLSSCYLGGRLSSQLKWIWWYDGRDEQHMSHVIYIYIYISVSPSLPVIGCSLSRLNCLWGKAFLIHLDWDNLAEAWASMCLCVCLYEHMCACCCLSVASSAESSNWRQVMLR